ncbi:MAG: hypothetical protein IPG23_01040 [Burkholderiales bacterium]|nr:hypothetical protein [Burkholderiales bacterium]
MTITCTQALFIKLGNGNKWADECFANGTSKGFVRLDYSEIPHKLANGLPGNSEAVFEAAINFPLGATTGASRRHVNEICKFYASNEQVLWFTFHANRLWWCFSKHKVTPEIVDGTELKRRSVIGRWSDANILGETLLKSKLSGNLLKTEGFKGTICVIADDVRDYLLNKINGTVEPHVRQAQEAQQVLSTALIPVIQHLHPADFEILVDLIFMHGGWQRVGISGGTEKDIDLDLESPITGEHIAVQVKSKANVGVWSNYRKVADEMKDYSRFYFVTHSPDRALQEAAKAQTSADGRYVYWDEVELTRHVIRSGLTGWVLDKAA